MTVTWDSNLADSPKADGRVRLSKLWVPTGGIAVSSAEGCRFPNSLSFRHGLMPDSDPHVKLVRAGFLRQVGGVIPSIGQFVDQLGAFRRVSYVTIGPQSPR